ncbi:MAG TPA: hypothetical protein VIG29_05880, partial [Vicinamibacteria bacterium]
MAHHDSSAEIAANRSLERAASAAVIALAFALSMALFGSALPAVLYAISLVVFAAPGIPLARRWFEGPLAILAGAALGYLASSLLAMALFRFGLLRPIPVLAAAAALYAASSSIAPRRAADPERWLAAALLVPLLLVALPFLKVGASVEDGVAFRAYFSADLMTHLSVVAELQKGVYPPQNPFYAGETLPYYWLFFVQPAAFGASGANQPVLLTLYLASGMLFAGLLFCAARTLGLAPPRAFLATAVLLTAVSYEGLFAAVDFRNFNVDAYGRWALELTSLDGLHRSLLYTPQHLFSYSLLVVLLVLLHRGEPSTRSGAALLGLLLGGMAGASIVTALLAGPWTIAVLFFRRASFRGFLESSLLVTIPALLLLGIYVAFGFFGAAGGALLLRAPQPLEIASVLLLDCGALLLLTLLRVRSSLPRFDRELLALAGLALLAVLFLDVKGYEGVWMAWRAGSVLLVGLGFLAMPALAGAIRPVHALVILPALATTALDLVNAQDLRNRELSAGGFRWTTVVSRDEWEGLLWLRSSTPKEAVAQYDVRAREPGDWALLPAIAERRMAVGSPIFLLDPRRYRARERRDLRPIFASGDPEDAHRRARALGIDYLFLGPPELQTRGERVRSLFESPDLFPKVFSNRAVT